MKGNIHLNTHMNPSPATDVSSRKNATKMLQDKVEHKLALQRELGWPTEAKRPIVCLPCGMTDELGGELLREVLPGLLSMPVELLIRGKGTSAYGTLFSQLVKNHGHRVAIIQNDPESVQNMFNASDMALFLCDPTDCSELKQCLKSGVVPVSMPSQLIENYDPNQERGNAFIYEKANVWHCFAGLVRAMETYRFPFDWRTIQRHAIEND